MADRYYQSSTLLQYLLELERCGMNGSPLSTLSNPERRERLLPFYNTSIALDGILTFISKRGSKIIFVQIPSNLCGIPLQ